MNRTVHERTFLEAFFAADSIVGRIADRRAVFDEIGKICCISNKRLGELCKYIDLPELEEIKDPSSYEQLMRVLDYSEKFGTGAGYGADILDLLECKGKLRVGGAEEKLRFPACDRGFPASERNGCEKGRRKGARSRS